MANETVSYGEPVDRSGEAPTAEHADGPAPHLPPRDIARTAADGGARRGWVVPLLVALVVVMASTATTFALLWRQRSGTAPDEVRNFLVAELPAVEQQARRLIDLLMNYDSTNLPDRADEIRSISTGAFRDQYDELIGQGLGEALEEASASSRGQIVSGPEVSFRSPSEAIAIARVGQTTQSEANPGGQGYLYVLEITLVKVSGGEWLADQVEILSEELA